MDAARLADVFFDAVTSLPREYVFRPAQELDFRHLDLALYQRYAADFSRLGFSLLADIENVAINEAHGMKTFMRTLSAPHGTTTAVIYQVKPKLGLRDRFKAWRAGTRYPTVFEVMTHFSDGTSIGTTVAPATSRMCDLPGFTANYVDPASSVSALVAAHVESVRTHAAAVPGRRIRPVRDVAELVDCMTDFGIRQYDYLNEHGVCREFIAAHVGDPSLVDEVHALLQDMHRGWAGDDADDVEPVRDNTPAGRALALFDAATGRVLYSEDDLPEGFVRGADDFGIAHHPQRLAEAIAALDAVAGTEADYDVLYYRAFGREVLGRFEEAAVAFQGLARWMADNPAYRDRAADMEEVVARCRAKAAGTYDREQANDDLVLRVSVRMGEGASPGDRRALEGALRNLRTRLSR